MPPKNYYAVFVHEYVSTQLLKLDPHRTNNFFKAITTPRWIYRGF